MMEQSKPSEETIIKLGKKIVRELKLEHRSDTLSKWMAHYLAELFDKIDKTQEKEECQQLKKECCEIILKIWSMRDYLPESVKPLSQFKPIMEVLDALKQDEFSYPFWSRSLSEIPKEKPWGNLVNLVRRNSEEIFELSSKAALCQSVLAKEEEWIEEFRDLLSKEEKAIFYHLGILLIPVKGVVTVTEKSDLEKHLPNERYQLIFDKIEDLINEQKESLDYLRKTLQDELRDKGT